MTLVKMVRQPLFKTVARGVGSTAMRFCRRKEREIGLNSEFNKEK